MSLRMKQANNSSHIESKSLKSAVVNLGEMSKTFAAGSVLFV